jgi:hypothetical protein
MQKKKKKISKENYAGEEKNVEMKFNSISSSVSGKFSNFGTYLCF